MKKLLLTILLMMTATVIIAKSKEIKVSTPEEFIKAIGSNRVITVSGIINLSDVLQSNEKSQKAGLTTISEGSEATQRASRENVFDGYQLVLNQVCQPNYQRYKRRSSHCCSTICLYSQLPQLSRNRNKQPNHRAHRRRILPRRSARIQ